MSHHMRGDDDDEDDGRSVCTVVPLELETVQEEDEGDVEESEEERNARREELGRPRTPEPSSMGMHDDDFKRSRQGCRTVRRWSLLPSEVQIACSNIPRSTPKRQRTKPLPPSCTRTYAASIDSSHSPPVSPTLATVLTSSPSLGNGSPNQQGQGHQRAMSTVTILTTQGRTVFSSESIPISPILERESEHGGLTTRPAGHTRALVPPLTASPTQSLGQDQDQGANQSQSREGLDRSLGSFGRVEGVRGRQREGARDDGLWGALSPSRLGRSCLQRRIDIKMYIQLQLFCIHVVELTWKCLKWEQPRTMVVSASLDTHHQRVRSLPSPSSQTI